MTEPGSQAKTCGNTLGGFMIFALFFGASILVEKNVCCGIFLGLIFIILVILQRVYLDTYLDDLTIASQIKDFSELTAWNACVP